MSRGLLIAIEGGDGSGKATQAALTKKYIESELERSVYTTSFPRYGHTSALFAERYLNGVYGDIDALPPEVVALLFATDRMAGTAEVQTWLEKNPEGIAVLDRYSGSNLAHQGAKITDKTKRYAFYEEMNRYEEEVLGMLRPDLNIVLTVPALTAQQNVDAKDARGYTDKKRDIHEANTAYLERVKETYKELCALYPDRYHEIECTDQAGQMRSREAIQRDIRHAIAACFRQPLRVNTQA